ncbi:hypothetical protein B0H11DRAFT_2355681 [Mycena galericulata]|nr:hypothetical protein B0H11DRAFT_2355681 [Mycena galericulata]
MNATRTTKLHLQYPLVIYSPATQPHHSSVPYCGLLVLERKQPPPPFNGPPSRHSKYLGPKVKDPKSQTVDTLGCWSVWKAVQNTNTEAHALHQCPGPSQNWSVSVFGDTRSHFKNVSSTTAPNWVSTFRGRTTRATNLQSPSVSLIHGVRVPDAPGPLFPVPLPHARVPRVSPLHPAHQPPFSTYPAHVYPAAPASEGGTGGICLPSRNRSSTAPPPPPPSPHPNCPAHGPQHISYPSSPTYARASTPASSSISTQSPAQGREKPLVRRGYHPNPPAHRFEWVMWMGHVPSDAGHDELWRFFTQVASSASSSTTPPSFSAATSSTGSAEAESGTAGVLSIFLISRSSCSLVNYDTEPALLAVIARFM